MNLLKNSLIAPSLALLLASSLYANENYTLNTSSLSDAIKQISQKADMPYIVDMNILKGKSANEVKDAESLEEALKILLKGTGLEAIIQNNTIVIIKEEVSSQSQAKLGDVEVVGNITSPYTSNSKPGLLRGNIDLADTAKSVQIYTKDFIEDYQVQDVNDAITMSSNTIYEGDNHGRSTDISMRGFSDVPILIDGLKISSTIAHPEIFNLESIEVLKGPDSLQFGNSSPGGIVNITTKKPIKETSGEIEIELNDNISISPKLDVGGSLNTDETLYYRLISTFEYDEGSDSINTEGKKIFFAPSVSYDINDNNTLTFVSEYTKETAQLIFGTYTDSDGNLIDGYENTSSNPDEELKLTQKVVGFDLESNFDSWNSNFRYRYTDYIYDSGDSHMPFIYSEATNSITRFYASQKRTTNDNSLQYTFNTENKLADLKNKISLGVDYNKYSSQTNMFAGLDVPYIINMSNPNYESLTAASDHTLRNMSSNKVNTTTWGTFLKDTLYLSNSLVLNAGVRYSYYKPDDSEDTTALSPSIGLVKHLSPRTSIYTSYSESFSPNSTLNVEGDLLDPETGKGVEFGIRQKLFNDNFNLTASLFKIDKENVSQVDSDNSTALNTVHIASGKQTSKGFEIDINGDITPLLSLIASYGYTDTKDKDNNNNKIVDIPHHTANIFAKYNLANFDLPGFDFTGGINYIGKKYGDTSNSIQYDSSTILNASITYSREDWKASLSVQNIGDEDYVYGTMVSDPRGTRVYAGKSRTFIAKLKYSF